MIFHSIVPPKKMFLMHNPMFEGQGIPFDKLNRVSVNKLLMAATMATIIFIIVTNVADILLRYPAEN